MIGAAEWAGKGYDPSPTLLFRLCRSLRISIQTAIFAIYCCTGCKFTRLTQKSFNGTVGLHAGIIMVRKRERTYNALFFSLNFHFSMHESGVFHSIKGLK